MFDDDLSPLGSPPDGDGDGLLIKGMFVKGNEPFRDVAPTPISSCVVP